MSTEFEYGFANPNEAEKILRAFIAAAARKGGSDAQISLQWSTPPNSGETYGPVQGVTIRVGDFSLGIYAGLTDDESPALKFQTHRIPPGTEV